MRLLVAIMLAVSLGAAPAALAQSSDPSLERAEKLFKQGERQFSMGRFDGALRSYQAAHDEKPLPDLLFNIAQCHRNLGDRERAIKLYRQYLREQPEASNREAVETLIADLERELAAEKERNPVLDDVKGGDGHGNGEKDRGGKPIYKRWQFWAGVAAVTVAGGATSYYFLRDDAPSSDLGNLPFDK